MNLEEWRESGLQLIQALRVRGEEDAFRRLLSDLYPDTAHFIYELFQNAEDAQADTCRFTLSNSCLAFEHNGARLFSAEDVKSITSFANSTKREDPTTIGEFGVGFKAVFAYTNTPEIHSGEFHFRIHDLVVPETDGVSCPKMGNKETRFIFPFDNPRKTGERAVRDVERGLRALGNNTLLFLSHIRKIEYFLPDGSLGSLERIDQPGGRIEIRSNQSGKEQPVSHWLRFEKEVTVADEDGKSKICRIAIAYSIKKAVDKKGTEGYEIVPLEQGQVSIYFPAEKETSNLRFHMHAPFASTIARDSVRDCEENLELRNHLVALTVESLTAIRDQGLLTVEFLATLPNPQDKLPLFYVPIREAIIQAFNENALIPTTDDKYATATEAFQGPSAVRGVITPPELCFLAELKTVFWAKGVAAKKVKANPRPDQFLKGLEIKQWGWKELQRALHSKYGPYTCVDSDDVAWLEQRSDEWLRKLYLRLGEALVKKECSERYITNCNIIRVAENKKTNHVAGKNAYFPKKAYRELPQIKSAILKGKNKQQDKKIEESLVALGVQQIGDDERIDLILEKYYSDEESRVSPQQHLDHVKFFVEWWKEERTAGKFDGYSFLFGVVSAHKTLVRQAGKLCFVHHADAGKRLLFRPEKLYIDIPYIDTKLDELFSAGSFSVMKHRLSDEYASIEGFTEFALELGVFERLGIETIKATKAQNKTFPKTGRRTESTIDKDYFINGAHWANSSLPSFLGRFDLEKTYNFALSYQVWRVMCQAPASVLQALYVPNDQRRRDAKSAPSFIIKYLSNRAWVPDREGKGNFHKPCEMTRDQLPDEFEFRNGNGWLTAIEFGKEEQTRKEQLEEEEFERQETTKRLRSDGIDLTHEKMKALSAIPEKDLENFLDEYDSRKAAEVEFPEHDPKHSGRRKEKIEEGYDDATQKTSVKRERAVRQTALTQEARAYLEPLNTNDDGQLVCQMCQHEMPFRLRNGNYHFEVVQIMDDLKKESRALYLALCPVCAAKYKLLVKKHEACITSFRDALTSSTGTTEFSIDMHDSEMEPLSIRFTGTHLLDIRTILARENNAIVDDSSGNEPMEREKDLADELSHEQLVEQLTEALSNILLGDKISLDVVDVQSGDIMIPANRKITKTLLRKLAANYENIEIDPSPIRIKIMSIIDNFRNKFSEIEDNRNNEE